MKKLITTATFLLFGTMYISAQTNQKMGSKTKVEKKSEMKMKSTNQQKAVKKNVDTANLEQRQKEADEKLQRQTIPQKDGLNNEAVKPAQTVPTELE